MRKMRIFLYSLAIIAVSAMHTGTCKAEVILQYFNLGWQDLAEKIPELAEVGYDSLWLPPPTKSSSVYSAGYDLFDPWDLGSKDQKGSVRTRYGTEADLLELIRVAHRFGIRVYFDNIVNHRAFDVPGYNENTPIDIYPGTLPEDFHLRITPEGFYRKWGSPDWNDAGQVLRRDFSDLIDMATENGDNINYGPNEQDTHPKIFFVRQPNQPEFYDYHPTLGRVGFYNTNITEQVIADNPDFYREDIGSFNMRAVRWLIDRTKVDGLRLDAVKHVPDEYFGDKDPATRDFSNVGYTGQAQEQFNITRGYSDGNHRDSVFNSEQPRDDLMIFGEHLGGVPLTGGYIDAGMRLVDFGLRSQLGGSPEYENSFPGVLGNGLVGLQGLDQAGSGGAFNDSTGIMYCQSHDNVQNNFRHLQHAIFLTRKGVANIYTDGNFQSETLQDSGGAFPRHANNFFLGQFGDNRVPELIKVKNEFSRGEQIARWADDHVLAHERRDKRKNGSMSDADGTVMLFMLNDNSAGESRPVPTSFPAGTLLYQYAKDYGNFYYTVPAGQTVDSIVPPSGYFIFSYRTPEESDLWPDRPISIYENGESTGFISYMRKDGPDGDPGFNPYGVADSDTTDFQYEYFVPRVSDGSNLRFVVRMDGSTENIKLKLDGGVDINSQMGFAGHPLGDPRDNPPALAYDYELGYEQIRFVARQHPEKFAAEDIADNTVGSSGAEVYEATIGSAGFNVIDGNGFQTNENTASWVYHSPTAANATTNNFLQFFPAPENAANQSITVWTKVGFAGDVNKVFLYYTTDGSYPEGAGGIGVGSTKSVELFWNSGQVEAGGTADWWQGSIPALADQTALKYKIGVYRDMDGGFPVGSIFPSSLQNVASKKKMMTTFEVDNFNAETVQFRPHNDYGITQTGLDEGFHILKAHVLLNRPGQAPIYNEIAQVFYYDAERPDGEIVFPNENDNIGDLEYGVVVRTDHTVNQVMFHIDDADAGNDDSATSKTNGNGTAIGGSGEAWAEANPVTPSASINSPYPKEWRFTYRNIPSGGSPAAIKVRFLEYSSSTNMALTDSQGNFKTVTRNIQASAPNLDFEYAWPEHDGTEIGEGWKVRLKFSNFLANGLTEAELRDSFLITIDDDDGIDDPVVQGKSLYEIVWNVDAGHHQIEYPMPNLYNPTAPDQLFNVEISHETAGGLTLSAGRLVKALPTGPDFFVEILDPIAFDSDGRPFVIELPDVQNPSPEDRSFTIRVETDSDADNVWMEFDNPATSAALTPSGLIPNPQILGNKKFWRFTWSNLTEGVFFMEAMVDTDSNPGTVEASATRTATVEFRELVQPDPNDADDDDDGLLDANEAASTNLPLTNAETWLSGEVHIVEIYGNTDPLSPDTDDDGLPDGLESGWRNPVTGDTDTNRDMNGDGFKNFISDLDPPLYNTVPDHGCDGGFCLPGFIFNAGRTDLIHGSMTDPSDPDTDGDGILDGVEDANRDGWVQGDGMPLQPGTSNPWDDRPNAADFPDGVIQAWETWMETDPTNPDSDLDGTNDGSEDADRNGVIAGDSNNNRVRESSEEWSETNPVNPDTDGDGLPDGWEVSFALDPLDNGTDSMRTAAANDGDAVNGPHGNPDMDVIVIGGVTNPYTNELEFQNGTNPRQSDNGVPPPEGAITLGPGEPVGDLFWGTQYTEFLDWTADDCLALDEYEGDGPNHKQGDTFISIDFNGVKIDQDGFETSRDIIAVYARDGGDAGNGGDGKFHFRVDLFDLQAFAEEEHLNIYVVVDTGQPSVGEMALPDDVDTLTSNRWEAVVAVYQSGLGRVFIDTDHNQNTSGFGQDIFANGVIVRDQSDPLGFIGAYFNSELDAVEFSISRQALIDAGWNGLDPTQLNYQFFTTRDGTQNDGSGAGDIPGRSDIRDAVYNDNIAEDYPFGQENVPNALGYWIPGSSKSGLTKVALVLHGNQPIYPGSRAQFFINDGAGGGLYRAVDAHDVFGVQVDTHFSPTFASALEWANTDPANGFNPGDGPAFNQRLRTLVETNLVSMMGCTFSDHLLPYFPKDYNRDSETLARDFLGNIFGSSFDQNSVFWPSERVMDDDVIDKILDMGYNYSLIDQMTHLFFWFGRESAVGDSGFRINRINGLNCFVVNELAGRYRYLNDDKGLSLPMRNLMNRKGRSGVQDQVIILYTHWEDFLDPETAYAYDINVRWIANHPWIKTVNLDEIARGDVDVTGDGQGDQWGVIDHGTGHTLDKIGHDWIQHATQNNYDSWYFGSSQEEGLASRKFKLRPTMEPAAETPMAFGTTWAGGIVKDAWDAVASIADTNIARLASAAIHASTYVTAFHNQSNIDFSRFSNGEYIFPDQDVQDLAKFAVESQGQTRKAVMYKRLDQWATFPPGQTFTWAEDIDLDGEHEYMLYNDKVFAVFERSGGRMVSGWVKDPLSGNIYQVVGNLAAYAGTESEEEGTFNVETNGNVGAYRTSCLKDWFATKDGGTALYVNELYDFVDLGNGWRITSVDGNVQKTVTLDDHSRDFEVSYDLLNDMLGETLYIRNGFSPDLYDLLLNGQDNLGSEEHQNGIMTLKNQRYFETVSASVKYGDAGHSAQYNFSAVDDDPSNLVLFFAPNMRNQAQTHQTEIYGSGSFNFALGFQAGLSDLDEDGIPNLIEDMFGFLDSNNQSDALLDEDMDGINNLNEHIAGTDMNSAASYPYIQSILSGSGMTVEFPSSDNREYRIWYTDAPLTNPDWTLATPSPLPGNGGILQWLDDGSSTSPAPDDESVNVRYYKYEVSLP